MALAQALCDNGHDLIVYDTNAERVQELMRSHTAQAIFGEHRLPDSLVATTDFVSAVTGREAILLAVPTSALAIVLEQVKPYLHDDVLLINAAKGFDRKALRSPMEAMRAVLGERSLPYVSVLGPSHAEEVILRKLTCICAVCEKVEPAKRVQALFSNHYLRFYTCLDPIGAEAGAAVKNVIAIAAGLLDGLNIGGDNAKAALVSRGICEILRYGERLGAKKDTFFGLTGVGDLVVTCFSIHSRNYRAGLQIGRDDSVESFFQNNHETVEGVFSCRVIAQRAKEMGIDMPLVQAVYDVLFCGVTPSVAVRTVMMRPLKEETL